MKKSLIILFLLFAIFNQLAYTQESHDVINNETGLKHHKKHKLAIYTGFTNISAAFYEHETHEQSTGKWVPTLGLDYFYSLNNKWEIGALIDMEFDNYIIRLSDNTEEERLNVAIAAVAAKYKINKFGILLGPGIELEFSESTKKFFVFKMGLEYEIEIENGWEISPSFMYDYKQEYSSYAYGFSIGKRF